MPTQPTTRAQISGYNFLVRRMEHAIVRRDVRMLFDPMRSQTRAFVVGIVLAVLVMAGFGVLALFKPQDKIKENKILVSKESGALYVKLGDTIHPALNIASARLALGEPANEKPAVVADKQLAKQPRGQLLGIPGAPSSMPYDRNGDGKIWSVCDVADPNDTDATPKTSVIVGNPVFGDQTVKKLGGTDALLLRASGENDVYLAYDTPDGAKRAQVDMTDRKITAALGIGSKSPRVVSPGLLNAIPNAPELTVPKVGTTGKTLPYTMPSSVKSGAIVYTSQAGKEQYYVAMEKGIQQISPVVADMIRNNDSVGLSEPVKITTDMSTVAPPTEDLTAQLKEYPTRRVSLADPASAPVDCLSWKPLSKITDRKQNTVTAEVSLLVGRKLPVATNTRPVPLVKPDTSSSATFTRPQADDVYIAPASGDFVQATGIEVDSQRADSLYYVNDAGVAFGIDNAEAAKALGFEKIQPEPAPWPIMTLLASGPSLNRDKASVAHDGMLPDPNAGSLPATQQPGN